MHHHQTRESCVFACTSRECEEEGIHRLLLRVVAEFAATVTTATTATAGATGISTAPTVSATGSARPAVVLHALNALAGRDGGRGEGTDMTTVDINRLPHPPSSVPPFFFLSFSPLRPRMSAVFLISSVFLIIAFIMPRVSFKSRE